VNRPARVLFVTPSLKGGGAERVLVTLLGHLDPARFEPVLATFFEGNDYPQLLPQSVRHIDFRCSGRLAFPRLCRRLARAICEERPDLVVSFMNYTNLVAIVAAGLARIDVPVIIVEQTPLALHFGNKRSLGRRFRRAGARWLYPRARAAIAPSKGLCDELSGQFGVPAVRCHVVPNPVDFDLVRQGAADALPADIPADGLPLITTCGRLEPLKNQVLLLEAFAEVRKDHPARLCLLGEGPERGRLHRRAKELGLADSVIMPGFQRNPFRYLAASTVFALTSNWEGFGNVIIEAMACGAPVVSSDCDYGPREIIRDGENGLLFPPGDRQALAERLSRLLGDAALRVRLADAGRQSALRYDAEAVARQYEAIIDRVLLADSSGGRP